MGHPKEILILRHAEKPADTTNENLSPKGYERAAALSLYIPKTFGAIDHIFAAGIGEKSNSKRPLETITPLAESLNKKVHHSFLKYQYPEMISHIFEDDAYTDTTVVIAWQHTDIESIATKLGAQKVPTTKWPEDRFDLVWKLTLNEDKSYTLTQIPQLLMFGDLDEIITDPVKLSFCEELQTIDPQKLCGMKPMRPVGNFPNQAMSCIFQIPTDNLPKGLTEQYIFVGAGFLLSEQSIIDNQIAAILNVANEENDVEELQIPFSDPVIDKRAALSFELTSNETYHLNKLAKVGLTDDHTNDLMNLVAAVLEVDQLLNFASPETQKAEGMVNFIAQGNLLIHCHDGGSRSVTIAALYLYYKFYIHTEITFQQVYTSIICLRWNRSVNNHPTQGICENAYEVLTTFETLFPEPIRKK